MRSEIPQLEVITAIADADQEDFLAQLLYSQGYSIIFRAFDALTLKEYLDQRGTVLRTLVIFKSDLPEFQSDLLFKYGSTSVTFISLDEVAFSSHGIMQKIRSQLRLPLVHQANLTAPVVEQEITHRKRIVVTGSSGAPGRTRFAMTIVEQLALNGSVTLIDSDFRNQTVISHMGNSGSQNFAIEKVDFSLKPRSLVHSNEKEVQVLDLGILPPLDEVVNDRRWQGTLTHDILESTTHIVYVLQTTSPSIAEFERFLNEFPILLKQISMTYVCVISGQSKKLRAAEKEFLRLVRGENHFLVRESELWSGGNGNSGPVSLIDQIFTLGASKKQRKEMGKIAQSLI